MIVLKVIKRLYKLLPKRYSLRGAWVVILLAVNSGLEVAGLGAIIPLVLVVLEEGAVSSNEWLRQVNSVFHLSENQFILLIGVSVLLFLLIKNIISMMLNKNVSNRLQNTSQIKSHPFFEQFDWVRIFILN